MKTAIRIMKVLFLILGLIFSGVTSAATITVHDPSEANGGLVLISNETWESVISILTADAAPFTLSEFPKADTINVTAKFVDEAGNVIDMTGDGIPDIWTYTEDNTTPGVWRTNITVGDVEPGIYTLRISAIVENSTTRQIYDQAELTEDVLILGGPYAIQIANVKDGENLRLGVLQLKIEALSDLGSLISIGNITNVRTILDNNTDGLWGEKIDINEDGNLDGWITFVKNSDSYEMLIFTRNQTLLEELLPEESIEISGGDVTYKNKYLRYTRDYHHFSYYTYILWDNSPLAKLHIKAIDYYIIPYKGKDNWKITQYSNGHIFAAVMRVKVIKRTSWFGLFTGEEVVFDGNLWTARGSKTIDNIITMKPRIVTWSWYPKLGYGIIWRAAADITAPKGYSLKQRESYNVEFRGDDPLDGLNWLSRELSKEEIDWWKLLEGDKE